MRKFAAVAMGLIILGLVNYGIFSREQLLTHGKTVLLELAPVDPRSLMQGDYMALRFAVVSDARKALNEPDETDDPVESAAVDTVGDGYIILALDTQGVGRFSRIDDGRAFKPNELKMRYRKRGNKMRFATNAFFFQEGKASMYEVAKYGEFKVGEDGESVLVAMWDEALQKIGE